MCVKTEQRTFPESPRACRPQVPCAEKVFFPEVIFAKPSRMVYIQHCLFWSKQIGSSSTASLKKNSTHKKKNPIPCWKAAPKTAIIYMLSFFSAVTGENNSVPACCPEICCAKANSCSKWQTEKAPRYLMDECCSLKPRGTFVRN